MACIRLVHGSLIVALLSLGLATSSTISPCGHGVSRRQYVTSRILVPIMDSTTFGACPLTDGKRQIFDNVSTAMAPFAAWEEAINFDEFFPIPVALVFQHAPEHGHSSVVEGRKGKLISPELALAKSKFSFIIKTVGSKLERISYE